MSKEIERKFLVTSQDWREGAHRVHYAQGYLSKEKECTVRIRIAEENAFLTIKGPVQGISRDEFEYSIPVEDAKDILQLTRGNIVEKVRHRIHQEGHLWEVDEFLGKNSGLVVAEVELSDPSETIVFPSWIGEEVTGDPRYYNSSLAVIPFSEWKPESC
jgi:CYTH domain-containing protein